MTTTSFTVRATEIGGLAPLPSKAVTGLMGWLGKRRKMLEVRPIAHHVEHLHAMSDHMLRDIGLHRGDIETAVRTGKLPDR